MRADLFRLLCGTFVVALLHAGCGDSGNNENTTPNASAGQAGSAGKAGSAGSGQGGGGAGGAGGGTAGNGGTAGTGGTGGASSGLTVSDANARGCEVLLTEKTSKVQRVLFGPAVKGAFVREAPRIAVTFVSKNDSAIEAGAVKIEGGALDGIEVTKTSCVDKSGAKLSGAKVTLVGGTP